MNETLKAMTAILEYSWNCTDGEIRKGYLEFCEAHKGERFDIGWGYKVTASEKYTHSLSEHERNACYYGERWFAEQNEKAALKFVENLEARVKAITGEITDWSVSSTEQSLSSYLVRGEKGAAKVSQIYAGGYNIVRLHIRNIVKKI